MYHDQEHHTFDQEASHALIPYEPPAAGSPHFQKRHPFLLRGAALALCCCLLGWWMLRSKTLEKYSLHKSIDSTAATPEQLSVKPGDEGVATTRLALIGNADIHGKTVEVKSADGFLDEGTPIVVVRVDEAQVLVKRR